MAQKLAVLGGGISGLAAAWNLTRCAVPKEIVLYEAGKRVGGWMNSEKGSNGAVFELGPRSLRTAGKSARATMEMISSLGLEEEVITSGQAAQRRLIYTPQHGIVEVPSNISWLFRTKPPFSKPLLGSVVKELFTKKGSKDESINDFISRRLGSEILEYLVDPMCRGIFASSVRSLSLQSCLPVLHQAEQKYGSVIHGMLRTKPDPIDPSACSLVQRSSSEKWSIYSLRNGLGTLPDALHSYLEEKGVQVELEKPCTRLDFKNNKVMVESGGQVEEFDHVISTVPTHALASLLSHGPHLPLVDKLSSIPSVSVGVVCLEYDGSDALPQEYREAFGYLVPSTVPSKLLGVVFDSASFPQLDRSDKPSTRLTVMLGGEWFESLFGSPDEVSEEKMTEAALDELRVQLGLVKQPSQVLCRIHKNCIPVYEVGHSEKLAYISQYLSRERLSLTATGSFYNGVSVNDTIFNAIESSNHLL